MRLTYVFLLLISTLCYSLHGTTQQYQPFAPNRTYHFENLAGDSIYSLKIDSVYAAGTDSVFRFNRYIKLIGSGLWPYGYAPANNLFGHKLVKKPAGEYLFLTASADTFRLLTTDTIGHSWQFSSNPHLVSTLTARTYEPIMGQMDSVLTILLSNNRTLRLSKNYGFLLVHPFMSYLDLDYAYRELSFHALPETGLGTPISDLFKIYDFQPGDMFGFSHWTLSSWACMDCCDEWEKWQILSRYDSPAGDSIVYQIRKQSYYRPSPGPPGATCNGSTGQTFGPVYTVNMVITYNNLYHPVYSYALYAPTQSWQPGTWNALINNAIVVGNKFNRREIRFLNYQMSSPGVFAPIVSMNQAFKYAEGLGLIEIYSNGDHSDAGTTMICYQKGTETWGDCQLFSTLLSSDDYLSRQPLYPTAYPNPFAEQISLTFGQQAGQEMELAVYSALGQLLIQKTVQISSGEQDEVITAEALPAGIYLLKISSSKGTSTQKLVKQ